MIPRLHSIENMISSSDQETVYLAACLLRTSDTIQPNERIKLLNRIPVKDRIRCYGDVCQELGEKELSITDFAFLPEPSRRKALATEKIRQIARYFNKGWIPDWTNSSERKWFPYYDVTTGPGLVFLLSYCGPDCFYGSVAFYFSEEVSDFVGRTFIDLYKEIL